MAEDEFEILLARCRESLSEISLRVPALDSAARPSAPAYALTPPAAPPKPAAPKPVAQPRPAPPPVPAAAPAPVEPPKPAAAPPDLSRRETAPSAPERPLPRPAAEDREEDEVFPPLRVRPKTPPPSAPLWRAKPLPTPPPAERADRRRAAAAAAAAVVAAGAFGVWLTRRPTAELDLSVGDADAMALRPERGDVLVAEGKELVDLSRDGRTLGRRPLDAPVDSLSWDQGSLWSADGRSASIVERAESGRSTVFTLNHVPGDVFVKDKYLWTSEKNGNTLHQFLISRSILGAILQPLDSFELRGLSPESFAIDEAGTLWVADQATRRLFRLRLESGVYKIVASAPLSPFAGPEGSLRDLSIDEDAVWILARPGNGRRTTLRRILLSRLDWTPA